MASTPSLRGKSVDDSTRRLASPLSLVFSVVFLVGWLLPILYVGTFGRDVRWMPASMRHLQRVASLFPNEVTTWSTYHIQIQLEGSPRFVELPLPGYFDMSIFGYRTRFHRMIRTSRNRRGEQARSVSMARWIADRYAKVNPGHSKITGVRWVRVVRPVPELRLETGRFRKATLEESDPRRTYVIGQVSREELEGAEPVRKRKSR